MIEITETKIKKYLDITKRALLKIKIILPKKTFLEEISKEIYDMAKTYFEDAKYFYKKKNFVNAFGCVNYAHGWLDCGARLGLFDVKYDSKLFTVDDLK